MRQPIWNILAGFFTTVLAVVVVLWGLSHFRVLGLSNSLFKGSQQRGAHQKPEMRYIEVAE